MATNSRTILQATYNYILNNCGEAHIDDIYRHLNNSNIQIGGKDPRNGLRSRLSRHKELFRSVGQSYWRTLDARGVDTMLIGETSGAVLEIPRGM